MLGCEYKPSSSVNATTPSVHELHGPQLCSVIFLNIHATLLGNLTHKLRLDPGITWISSPKWLCVESDKFVHVGMNPCNHSEFLKQNLSTQIAEALVQDVPHSCFWTPNSQISKFAWWLWLNIGYLKSSHGLSVVCKAIGSSIPNFTDFGRWHSNHQSRLVVKGIALLAWTQTFRDHIFFLWLVVDLPLWKMMEFVSWDDDIPNWMGKSIQIPWFQSPPTRYLINHY